MPKARNLAQSKDRRKARSRARLIKWSAIVIVVGLIGFGLSQMSNIAYTEDDIRVVSFTDLTARQRRSALEAANSARCTCGCGMNLAQCVSTDMTCPVREKNIQTIRGMVQEARASQSS